MGVQPTILAALIAQAFSASAPGEPTTAITLTDVVANRVYQRDPGATSGPVFVSGTYSGGAPSAVQAQVIDAGTSAVVVPWTTVDAAPSGGNWLGFVQTPQGGPYRVQVRAANYPAVQANGSNSAYVGIVIIGYGQSNMAFMFASGSMYSSPDEPIPAADSRTFVFDGSTWAAPAANGIRVLMAELRSATGVPVGAMHGAVSGQGISSLLPGDASGIYSALAARIAASGARAEFLLWHQGEGNAGVSTSTTPASYAASLGSIHNAIASAVGRTTAQMPLILAGLGRAASTETWTSPATWDAGQRMLMDQPSLLSNVYYSHPNVDVILFDGVHWTASSYMRAARRYARSMTTLLGLTTGYPSWSISAAATVDGTTTDVTVQHSLGTDFTPASGITGFEVSGDNGSTWVTATGVRVNPTTIRLTHASVATSSLRKLRYLYGTEPNITGLVRDNSALQVPLRQSGGAISPVPLAALPIATWRSTAQTSGADTTSSRTNVSIGEATPGDKLVVVGITSQTTSSGAASLTVTPNSGSPVVATKVTEYTGTAGHQIRMFSAVVPGAATLTDLAVTFGSSPFATPVMHVWTIPVTDLSSTTPVSSGTATSNSALSVTRSMATSDGGCVIGVGSTEGTNPTTAASEIAYTTRASTGLISGARHFAFDASNTGADADSSVVFGVDSASKLALAVVSFR